MISLVLKWIMRNSRDVNFLFAEQVLQDERLFSLEQDNDDINDELESELILVDIRFSFGIFCHVETQNY